MRGRLPWPGPLTPRRRQDLAREIEEELRVHLALRTEDNGREGMAPEEAEADALARFGDLDRIAAACLLAEDEHPMRAAQRMLTMGLTLTVGFAAFALAFALFYAVLLQPLRFNEAERIVRAGEGWEDAVVPVEDFQAWRTESTSFEHLTMHDASEFTLTGDGPPARVHTMLISYNFFDVFEVEPLLGRVFRESEVEMQAAPVVLVSEALWTERYRRSPSIIGRTLDLDRQPHTVVGVMPKAAQLSHTVAVWTPIAFAEGLERRRHYVAGRLHEGTTLAEARAEIAEIATQVAAANPKVERTETTFHPLHELYAAPVRPTVVLLFGVAVLVLVLVLAVTFRRALAQTIDADLAQPEASPTARGLEHLGVVFGAAVFGLGLAYQIHAGVYDALLDRWGPLFEQRIEGVVVLVVLILAMSISAGLTWLPRWLRRPRQLWPVLRRRLDRALSVVAVAVTVVLLAAFGQTARPYLEASSESLGFDEHRVLLADLPLSTRDIEAAQSYPAILERVRALPGVEQASLSRAFPLMTLRLASFPTALDPVEGEPPLNVENAWMEVIGTDYVETMGLSLLAGRSITEADGPDAPPVALVNAAFAERYGSVERAVGRHLDVGVNGHTRTVVGVVDDVHYFGKGSGAPPVVYLPHAQSPVSTMALVVRSEEPAEALAAAIQAATQAEVPGMAVNHVMYASTLRRAMVAEARTQVWLLGLMALAALGCAVVGIVQLVADHVRMRLPAIEQARSQGARSSVVLWQAWCPALVTVGGGGLLGLGVAWALSHGMVSGLLGETDGLVLAGAVAVGALVMLIASLIPARQALGIASAP